MFSFVKVQKSTPLFLVLSQTFFFQSILYVSTSSPRRFSLALEKAEKRRGEEVVYVSFCKMSIIRSLFIGVTIGSQTR